MKKIDIKCKTITPMFSAGADGKSFELRPPTIKGLLRFWWRACYWGEHSEKIPAKIIEEKEGELFGTTVNNGLKSSFSIRIINVDPIRALDSPFPKHNIMVTSRGKQFPVNILEYLAYGTLEYQRGAGNVFIREYLPVGHHFQVRLIYPDDFNIKEVVKSFYCLSIFGGLGAKSRNGFGRFEVTNPDEVFTPYGLKYPIPEKEFFEKIKQNTILPPYSAFSNGIKIFNVKKLFPAWDGCLAELGKIYRSSRNNLERKHEYEKRQYIGAPLVAFKEYKSFLERRAKPYFLMVLPVKNQYRGYILYLPSKYCDGLTKDRTGKPVPQNVDQKFHDACTQFNTLIANEMEGRNE